MDSTKSILQTVIRLKDAKIKTFELKTRVIKVRKEPFEQEYIIVHVEPYKRVHKQCPICRKKCPGYDTKAKKEEEWRAPNLNGVPVYLAYRPCRIKCPKHGVQTEYLPWSDGKTRSTAEFNNDVAWMSQFMPKSAIVEYLMTNWRTVGNCIHAVMERLEPDHRCRFRGLRRICVDETSYRKGQKYLTVVYDMDRNQVVWLCENHGLSVFERFCELLTEEERQAIEVVAGDGAKWIDSCVDKHFPNALRCIDFFHVAEWVNDALDDIRRSVSAKARRDLEAMENQFNDVAKNAAQELKEIEEELAKLPRRGRPSSLKRELLEKKAELETFGYTAESNGKLSVEHRAQLKAAKEEYEKIKNSRYALGKNPENLTEHQQERLKLIENDYPDMYRAYQLKEQIRLILHLSDVEMAKDALDTWMDDARGSGFKPLEALADKIGRHRDNILRSIECHANSAKSEACNTTIKALIKIGRGFRNLDNLFALIYLRCSDLVIPLSNRPQMTSEKRKELREIANERKRMLEEARRNGLSA